jgi:hypothetical protein
MTTKKKIKNNSKNQNKTEAKMIHLVRSTSLCKEKEKKIPRSNSPHEAKPINTKINYFGGQNRR